MESLKGMAWALIDSWKDTQGISFKGRSYGVMSALDTGWAES